MGKALISGYQSHHPRRQHNHQPRQSMATKQCNEGGTCPGPWGQRDRVGQRVKSHPGEGGQTHERKDTQKQQHWRGLVVRIQRKVS